MPIALRASGSDLHSSAPASPYQLAPTFSAQPASGDLLIAVLTSLVQGGITAPAGWTFITSQDQGSSLRSWAYYRVAGASEPLTPTWTLGNSAKSWGWAGAYSGVATASAPGWAVATPGASTAHGCPSIAVPANGWLVNAGAFRRTATGAASTYTINDGSAAERLDFSSNAGSGNDIGGAVYDSNRALTAGTYARTITSSQGESLDITYSFALTPADAPPLSGSGARWGILI